MFVGGPHNVNRNTEMLNRSPHIYKMATWKKTKTFVVAARTHIIYAEKFSKLFSSWLCSYCCAFVGVVYYNQSSSSSLGGLLLDHFLFRFRRWFGYDFITIQAGDDVTVR
jgi:hypothetical protein